MFKMPHGPQRKWNDIQINKDKQTSDRAGTGWITTLQMAKSMASCIHESASWEVKQEWIVWSGGFNFIDPPSPNTPDVLNGQWADSSVKVSQQHKASSWLTWQNDLSESTTLSATSSKVIDKHTGMTQFCVRLITCKPFHKSFFFLSFRRVLNVICSFLGNSPASEF